ncbi:MAG: hypothetical protein EPO22_06195 [Dehalococcoidia bacterium]|nr:MAG: hypothetical protein EPO22_06195 [Dehalococcoidia bacterium]
MTKAVVEGETRPYDDAFGADGLLRYRYRGTDPYHRDNVGLRSAMQQRVPLVYFHGIVPGLYAAEWPVYIVGDDTDGLAFTVSVDERMFAGLGTTDDEEQTPIRRRYATRLFRQRLHQAAFRERVVRAYQHHCAVCRLKRHELLEAAHIMPDADPCSQDLGVETRSSPPGSALRVVPDLSQLTCSGPQDPRTDTLLDERYPPS